MYEAFFGLRESPFNVTPDPRFIFFSKKHLEAFSSLLYGIESRKGFIAITGEVGAGKTTLCRVLIEQLKGSAKTSLILNPNLSDSELLLSIVEDFGIGVSAGNKDQVNHLGNGTGNVQGPLPILKNKKDCFSRLNQFLLKEFHGGSNVVLIIDEAQDLKPRSLEQIRLLSNLETDQHKLLQIVLIGQPELQVTLNSPSLLQLRQRIAVWYHLKTLDQKETEQYVNHRLRVAGWNEPYPLFDASAIEALFKFTGGVPRLINILCDRALLAAFSKELRAVNAALTESAKSDLAWSFQAEEPVYR